MSHPYPQTITFKWLERHDACTMARLWFREKFGEQAPTAEVWQALWDQGRVDWLYWATLEYLQPRDYPVLLAYLLRRAKRAKVSRSDLDYLSRASERAIADKYIARVLINLHCELSFLRQTSYEIEKLLTLKWLRKHVFKF